MVEPVSMKLYSPPTSKETLDPIVVYLSGEIGSVPPLVSNPPEITPTIQLIREPLFNTIAKIFYSTNWPFPNRLTLRLNLTVAGSEVKNGIPGRGRSPTTAPRSNKSRCGKKNHLAGSCSSCRTLPRVTLLACSLDLDSVTIALYKASSVGG
jgi:hypothetical protein